MNAWTYVQITTAMLLAILMKAEADAAVAVYFLFRRAAPRYEAVTAAGNVTLGPKSKELLGAILQVQQTVEAERNALAHGCFGIHASLPKSVLWLESTDVAHAYMGLLRRDARKETWTDADVVALLRGKVFHYTAKDLNQLLKQIEQVQTVVDDFGLYVRYAAREADGEDAAECVKIYDQLCSLAPIRAALRAQRERAEKNKRPARARRQKARRRRRKR